MSKWLKRALVSVPIVPLAPIAPAETTNGTIGTNGTGAEAAKGGAEPWIVDAEVAAAEWEERAAILEYDEGLPCDEAERLAREQIHHRVKFGADKPPQLAAVSAQPEPAFPGEISGQSVQMFGLPLEPSPSLTVSRPAVELPAAEYDAHLDTLIAALPDGSAERGRLAFAKRKGWCVSRGDERVFTRGRF